jgi:hypothetical protein
MAELKIGDAPFRATRGGSTLRLVLVVAHGSDVSILARFACCSVAALC